MAEKIYQLRISLRHTKPPIWRRVLVPSGITLGDLHEVIQVAMGWTDSHLHHFVLRGKKPKKPMDVIAQFNATGSMHDIFDAWGGVRTFSPATTPFGEPMDLDGEDEDTVTLKQVCPKVKSKITYEYDFGDGWEHEIEVQKILEPKPDEIYPICVTGKGACPPEDCGGVWGYYQLLEAAADPNHEDHEELAEWLGDDFDPNAFDINKVNNIFRKWTRSSVE